jgi:hypothetical protein
MQPKNASQYFISNGHRRSQHKIFDKEGKKGIKASCSLFMKKKKILSHDHSFDNPPLKSPNPCLQTNKGEKRIENKNSRS